MLNVSAKVHTPKLIGRNLNETRKAIFIADFNNVLSAASVIAKGNFQYIGIDRRRKALIP
jgi:hypothetical protein